VTRWDKLECLSLAHLAKIYVTGLVDYSVPAEKCTRHAKGKCIEPCLKIRWEARSLLFTLICLTHKPLGQDQDTFIKVFRTGVKLGTFLWTVFW
jgi:hypothetical protein